MEVCQIATANTQVDSWPSMLLLELLLLQQPINGTDRFSGLLCNPFTPGPVPIAFVIDNSGGSCGR